MAGWLCGGSSAKSEPMDTSSKAVRVVPNAKLFVSEPDPQGFGNDRNPPVGKAEGWTNGNWLKSRFHFSFAEYSRGPSNFGCLRVMNDDLVQPDRGFGTHPHRDMEIITFIVSGDLTHADSMGTKETLSRGSVQFMTAGTGIRHSEYNLNKTTPLRFVQSWIVPRKRGLQPNYGSMVGDEEAAVARRDKWMHLVSDVEGPQQAPVQINQDCNVFVAELTSEKTCPTFELGPSRQAYMLCVEGYVSMGADGKSLRQHDGAEIKGPVSLDLQAGKSGALVLMFEMAVTNDGRSDI